MSSFFNLGKESETNVKPTFQKIGEDEDKTKEQFNLGKQQEASETLAGAGEIKRGRGRPKGTTNTNKTQASIIPTPSIDATLFVNGTKIILNGLSSVASKIIKRKAEKVVSVEEAKEYSDDAKIIEEELEITSSQLGALASQSSFLAVYGPYLLAFGGLASWGVRLTAINAALDKLVEEQKKNIGKTPA